MSAENLDLNSFFDRKGSEAIHCFATSWNWDNGLFLLDDCIQHPLCATATAQAVFIASEPAYHLLKLRTDAEQVDLGQENKLKSNYDNHGLIARLVEKWNKNGFVSGLATSTYHNLENEFDEYRKIESKIEASLLPWNARDDIFREIAGKKVNCSEIDLEEFEILF